MQQKYWISLLLLLMIPGVLFAQNGKIHGTVIDAKTRDPLIGANIVVEGTSWGAATDVEGKYLLLNIPAGTYKIKSSYVGYRSVTVSNIRVNLELTTEANIEMSTEDVQVQAVDILAERPLVNKSATSAVRIIDANFLTNLPQRGIEASVALQPGVVQIGSNVYIRGSRLDETGYTLDGVTATDNVNGGRRLTIIDAAVEQTQVLAGGYPAEYGGANGGIVRTEIKAGGQQINASLQGESDQFTSQGKESLGGYSYGYRDVTATLGGPIVGGLKFFGSYENTYYQDWGNQNSGARFWSGVNIPGLLTLAGPTPRALKDIDTINLVYQPGNLMGGSRQINNFAGTLSFDVGGFQLRVGGGYAYRSTQDEAALHDVFDMKRLGINDAQDGYVNFKVTNFITPKTYWEVNLNYTYSHNDYHDPDFGDNLWLYGDSAANAKLGYTMRANGIPYDDWFIALGANKNVVGSQTAATYLGQYAQPGTPLVSGGFNAGYGVNKNESIGGRIDLTTQLKSTELKVGGEYTRYTYRQFRPAGVLQWAVLKKEGMTGDSLYNQLLSYGPNNIGYDVFGNEIDADKYNSAGLLTDLGPRHPVNAAGYVETKIELSDIVINAGLRYDYINSDAQSIVNPHYISKDTTQMTSFLIESNQYYATPSHGYVVPRLGFSFPVTDKTVFHAQYGKFVQMPSLNNTYVGVANGAFILRGGNYYQNTFGWGLRPERTTQYELGFQQLLADNASLDITAFYKDITDQIQYQLEIPASGAPNGQFPMLVNGDFATTKGIEFKFLLRRTQRVEASFNYTLSDAEATGSTSNTGAGAAVTGTGYVPLFLFPSTFNQTHRGNASLDYRFAKDDGGPILQQLGVNLLLNFNSGSSFTRISNQQQSDTDPRNRVPIEAIGSSTTGWFFQLDGRIDKAFQFGQVKADIYIYVINILNRVNPINVFPKTGDSESDGWLGSVPGQNDAAKFGNDAALYQALYAAVNEGLNVNNFGPPRQIRFGVRLEY